MIPQSANSLISSSHAYRQNVLSPDFRAYTKQDVVNFLKSSHTRYEKAIIPEIEQNFLGLMKMLPNEPTLAVIFNLFVKFQISFELHMQIEEQTMYPAALEMGNGTRSQLAEDCSHVEPFLTEIIECLTRQDYASNPFCRTLINRLVSFNEELKNHAWIEDNLI